MNAAEARAKTTAYNKNKIDLELKNVRKDIEIYSGKGKLSGRAARPKSCEDQWFESSLPHN